MEVARRPPGRDLAPYVRSLWVETGGAADDTLPPAGGPRLLVDLTDPGRVTLVGAHAAPVVLDRADGARRAGADLAPVGLAAFTVTPVADLADRVVDAAPHLRWSGTWPERLRATVSPDDTLEVLQQLLRSVRRREYEIDGRLTRAVRRLDSDPGIPIAALAAEAEVSTAALRRLFRLGVGLSPRAYAAVARAVGARPPVR